jgi:hypothetical protein
MYEKSDITVNAMGAVNYPPVRTYVAKIAAKIIFGASHIENVDNDSIRYFFLTHLNSSALLYSNLS